MPKERMITRDDEPVQTSDYDDSDAKPRDDAFTRMPQIEVQISAFRPHPQIELRQSEQEKRPIEQFADNLKYAKIATTSVNEPTTYQEAISNSVYGHR